MKQRLTYRDAGVNIDAGNEAVSRIKKLVAATYRPEVLTELGGFGAAFALEVSRYQEPVLVSGTDGVGTKLKIAFMLDKHDTVGIDLVAMCVNDILAQGAEPLFFLDYIATGKLDPQKIEEIVAGIAEGCRQAGCALIGGETAEMPGFYADSEYDLAGFAVGIAEKSCLLPRKNINAEHVLIGLPSSGIHSNGLSLARRAVFEVAGLKANNYVPELGCTVGEELLRPTRIYVQELLPLIKENKIDGLAHITGGGLTENVPRMLSSGYQAIINLSTWQTPAVFDWLRDLTGAADDELLRTFNMGIGMVLAVAEEHVETVLRQLNDAVVIGRVESGTEGVVYRE